MQLLLLICSIITSVIGLSPNDVYAKCDCQAFGTIIGQSFQTPAYSNCGQDDARNTDHFVVLSDSGKQIFTGIKWQCVEYARRWLIENRNITFASIDNAYQIWDLPYFNHVDTNEPMPVLHHQNGISINIPQVGDLLIYDQRQDLTTGHVAVIVGVDEHSVTIAEQNQTNIFWEHEYSRRLPLQRDADARFQIVDKAVIGWIHPLDEHSPSKKQ